MLQRKGRLFQMAIFRAKRDQSRRLVRLTPEVREAIDSLRRLLEGDADLKPTPDMKPWTDSLAIGFACVVTAANWARARELFQRCEVNGEETPAVVADFRARDRVVGTDAAEVVAILERAIEERDRELSKLRRKAGYAASKVMLLEERVRELEAKLPDGDNGA